MIAIMIYQIAKELCYEVMELGIPSHKKVAQKFST